MSGAALYDLPLATPASRAEIAAIQSARKRVAVERARRSPFWKPRLGHVDSDRLDDPDEWRKIPILFKEELRALGDARFHREFCGVERSDICEYWRSGGVTGRPFFYPRSFADIRHAMVGFTRTFAAAGVERGNLAHLSFPLGIHPAGQMWARAAQLMGIGVSWVGAGAAAPSKLQLELIDRLEPTVWMGMPSYGVHLANLAEAEGVDLAGGSVERILCTAEPLSAAKRDKLARQWGAEVFDMLGMTEVSMVAAEGSAHDGLHVWTDLVHVEVVDPDSHEPVAPGAPGALVASALYTNDATPFLRWFTGDIVHYLDEPLDDAGPLSVFPRLRHTHRTAGFFKVRGVNIGHAELEDYLFADRELSDFKAEAATGGDGNDLLRLSIEVARDADAGAVAARVATGVGGAFEVTPEVAVLEAGTLAREFESSVKAPRFVDRRG
ncbi:MAG: AMP-binding protein [Alphaproteobacteria bacterium]|nr:AMP-binding protein [Alphaproteobacteria bacterium]